MSEDEGPVIVWIYILVTTPSVNPTDITLESPKIVPKDSLVGPEGSLWGCKEVDVDEAADGYTCVKRELTKLVTIYGLPKIPGD